MNALKAAVRPSRETSIAANEREHNLMVQASALHASSKDEIADDRKRPRSLPVGMG